MSFDFDNSPPLRGNHTSNYDNIARNYGLDDPDAIAMWVADMHFKAAPVILDALKKDVEWGYCGYFANTAPVDEVVASWLKERHRWEIEPSWVRYTHGVISGYGDVITAYSEPGDGVIVFSPVYHAFFRQIEAMGRVVVESPLLIANGRFQMDLEGLAASLKGHEKIVTLCSPHNPGGRIWSAEELRALAEFCAEHDLILISDEIHMDLTFPGKTFVPTLVAAPEHANRIAVLTAASKAFNVAGAETGIAIYPTASMREKLSPVILDRESTPNRFGMTIIKAAFSGGHKWMDAAQAYLAENFRFFKERMEGIPGVSVMDMDATYLTWVSFEGLGMEDEEILRRSVMDAKVVPNPGTQFGVGGSGHLRYNVALPRAKMMDAIERLEEAFKDVQ
ncbi:MAG: aminotransferase class I/II-fold pyridoxal phosphate-dependent enzyme [Boseongicola sp.]|nr:aminotransferase class I/II-fold pyridoxal phosphate-dependent enzyme [Boseongicola sp.]